MSAVAGAAGLTGPDHRPATFADALRCEWTKIRTLRSTFWTLLTAAMLGIGALFSAVAAHHYAGQALSGQAGWDPTSVSLSGLALAQLAIGVLGVLVITSEYSTGSIQTSLAAVPRRGRFLAAKATVLTAVSLITGEATALTVFLLGQALISGQAPTAAFGQPGVLRLCSDPAYTSPLSASSASSARCCGTRPLPSASW